MADVNKSIEISYRADLKQLLANLKQMPNMTEKQAKEMVQGLQKQLRQAEKAAEKASKNTAKSFKRMETAAKRTTVNARSLRKEFANIDRLTSEASQGLSLISPALGDAAMQASVAASGIESLGRALMVSNPLFIVGAVVVGGLIAAFMHADEQAKTLAESEKRLNEALENSQKEYEKLAQSLLMADEKMQDFRQTTTDLRNELLLSKGEISQFEFESLQNAQKLAEFEKQIKVVADEKLSIMQKQSLEFDKRIQLLKEEQKLLMQSKSSFFDNSAINKELLDINEQINAQKHQRIKLQDQIKREESLTNQQVNNQIYAREQILKEIAKQNAEQEALREQEERRRKAAKAAADAERERLAILKEQEAIFNKINDSLKASQSNQEKAKNDLLDLLAQQDGKEAELQRKMHKQTEAINDQINAAQQRLMVAQLQAETDEQIFAAQELEKATITEIEALEVLRHEKRLAMEEEIAQLKEANAKKLNEDAKKYHAEDLQRGQDLFVSAMEFNNAAMTFFEKEGMQKRAQAYRMFRVNQSAALAEIGFAVAKGLAEAAGNPFMTAAVVATGLSSTAKVLAQKPPTADMGMIGNNDPLRPDETTTRVLRGEAVIDRATVNRLGGEQGIRNLQEGGAVGGGVVVVQPFKHFDRFIKQASQSGAIYRQNKPVRY